MSGKTLIDQIRHYQKDIERSPDNAERMVRCIKRLYGMPILVQHLQETGVGRSVNALRKYNGEVGDAAKALVAKWKAMVAAEESSEGEQPQEKPPEKMVPEQNKASKSSHAEKVHSSGRHRDNKDSESARKRSHSSRSETKEEKRKHDRHSSSSSKHKHSRHGKSKEKHESKDDSDDSSDRRKRKKHSSSRKSGDHGKSKRSKIVKEDTPSESEESDKEDSERSDDSDRVSDDKSEPEEEVEEEEEEVEEKEESGVEEKENGESDSDSSSDHRHRSKHKRSHKSSRSGKSSHSSKDRHRGGEKKPQDKHSHKRPQQDMQNLIKENEKKMKKEEKEEKMEKPAASGKSNGSPGKQEKPSKPKVKIEKNEDGSIDAMSGASFAEALMAGNSMSSAKKKKKSSSSASKKLESTNSTRVVENSPSSSSSSTNTTKNHDSNKSSPSKPLGDLMKMPDLLSKKVKMELLNLDISSTLPEISPHYKPLPHVLHDAMPASIAVRRLSKGFSEEEAMCSIMTTKYQRTKVFSGSKAGFTAVVPSLYSLCIQLLYDNIEAVEFTGGVPYDILKPLLEKLNADQLYVLEHHNPYLIEDTDGLWQFHCKKDFRTEPKMELESWRDLYLRCVDERERKLKALTENISKAMAKSVPVRQAKLAYVDSVAKPPRSIARKQAKFGTGTHQEKKQDILKKAVVGANNPAVVAKDVVPPPPLPNSRTATPQMTVKKKKAPLMAKALQLIKGNRFKR